MGGAALAANTTGTQNTAVGKGSLETNTTGGCNVAVGEGALYANVATHRNTAVGQNALCAATAGDGNTGIGRLAGKAITTGVNNTAIGGNTQAGTTGTNNIALGDGAGTDAVRTITTNSNEIVIGNNQSSSAYIKIDWTVTSDLRDKMNIEDVPYGLDFVNQLNPIKYNFKKSRENAASHGKARFGFKAQEILALEGDNPVLINNDDEDNLKLTGAYLAPVLVNAIKELKAEIELLKNK
jgi:trimeric autotransporter adhesin